MTFWLTVFIYATIQFSDTICNPVRNFDVYPFMANRQGEQMKEEVVETTTVAEEKPKNKCLCSKIYDPVCGTDDKSYYNVCRLECANQSGNVTVQHLGNCIPYRY